VGDAEKVPNFVLRPSSLLEPFLPPYRSSAQILAGIAKGKFAGVPESPELAI
jgi:hypothetical protein